MMAYMKTILLALLFLTPSVAAAQAAAAPAQGIVPYLTSFLTFLNGTVVPLLLALAFLFFIWQAVRYFILESADEEGRKKARSLALWGILAFVLMISIWGIVNFLTAGLGFTRDEAICPDYVRRSGDCPGQDTSLPDSDTSAPGTVSTSDPSPSLGTASAAADEAQLESLNAPELRLELQAREVVAVTATTETVTALNTEIAPEVRAAGTQLATEIDTALALDTPTEQITALDALAQAEQIDPVTAAAGAEAVRAVEAYEETARTKEVLDDPEVVAAREAGKNAVSDFFEGIRGIDDPARRALNTGSDEERLAAALTLRNTGRISPTMYEKLESMLETQGAYNRAVAEAERRQFETDNRAVLDLYREGLQSTGTFAQDTITWADEALARLEQIPQLR